MSSAFGGASSNSNGSYTSTPINEQLPGYTNLAPGVASGLSTAFNVGPNGISAPGGALSPFTVNGGSSGASTNPLVAPTTGAQNTTLGNIGTAGNNLGSTLAPGFSALNSFLDPNYASNLATSPQTQAAVQAAINPIAQQFQTQTQPGLVSSATSAGQKVQGAGGQGSSAFDQAYATAQGNLQSTEAQTAGNIVNSAYQTGLNIQANAPAQLQNLSSGELSSLVSTLNAQALPQLTQQYGISAGTQLYQQQVSTLLQALGLGGQVSQPAIAYNSTGTNTSTSTQSPNIVGTLLSGIGSAAGGAGALGIKV